MFMIGLSLPPALSYEIAGGVAAQLAWPMFWMCSAVVGFFTSTDIDW
jgi:hypothetical protein